MSTLHVAELTKRWQDCVSGSARDTRKLERFVKANGGTWRDTYDVLVPMSQFGCVQDKLEHSLHRGEVQSIHRGPPIDEPG